MQTEEDFLAELFFVPVGSLESEVFILIDFLLADCIDANRSKRRKFREFSSKVSSGEEVSRELGRALELFREGVAEHRGCFVVDDAVGTVSGVTGDEVDAPFPHDCDRAESFDDDGSERDGEGGLNGRSTVRKFNWMEELAVDFRFLEVAIHQGLEGGGVSLRVEKGVELRREVRGFFANDVVGLVVESVVEVRGFVVTL